MLVADHGEVLLEAWGNVEPTSHKPLNPAMPITRRLLLFAFQSGSEVESTSQTETG